MKKEELSYKRKNDGILKNAINAWGVHKDAKRID
jgi:hypothetical protein